MSQKTTPAAGADGAAAPITFSSFVIGLATQALMFLGAVPDPRGGEAQKNPAEAAAIIGVIEMLATKTRGNLTEDEAKLVEEVLFELRTRYVNETRQGAKAPPTPAGATDPQQTPDGASQQKDKIG